MRKFDLSKKIALETAAVVADVEHPAAVDTIEAQELDISSDEVVEYSSGLDTLISTTDALESLVASMESSLVTGGLTRQAFDFAQMHAQHLTTSIGLDMTIPSMESAGSRLAATEIALESVKETAANAFKAIVEFLKRLYEAMSKKLGHFKDWIVSTAANSFDKLKTFTDEKFNVKVNVNIAVFKINGTFNGKAIAALQTSLEIAEKLSSLDDAEEKLYSAFNELANADYRASSLSLMTDVDNCATYAHRQLDDALKFDKNTSLTTTLVAGKSRAGLSYEIGNPKSFSVTTEHNPPEFKMMSLRELGLDHGMSDRLKEFLNHLLDTVKKMQAFSDQASGARWDKYKHITKDDHRQNLVRICTLLSAIISRFERVQVDAVTSIYDGFAVLRTAIESADKAVGAKSE